MTYKNNKPIRLGMVGGGQGAFIGAVHRMVACLDGHYEFVAGALSSTPEKSIASGLELGFDKERCYPDFKTMAEKESKRPDGIEAVVIVTPNVWHFEPTKTFLEAGIHVFCDKPLTSTLADAQALKSVVDKAHVHLVITHNYTANPLIRQARQMIADGDLGDILIVRGEYAQGWLARPPAPDNKKAAWRIDPKQAGGGAIGDIGTHVFQLMEYVSGLTATQMCTNLSSFGDGHSIDDNAQVLLEYNNGARGTLWASQVAIGCENDLKLGVYGTHGTLEWEQEDPNKMWFSRIGEPKQLLTRGGKGSLDVANAITRVPAGHPEGYLEAFANIYTDMAPVIKAGREGKKSPMPPQIPNYQDGLRGMQFIDACQRSSNSRTWVSLV